MVVFGGIFEVTKELNDMLIFDFAAKKWSVLFEEIAHSPIKGSNLNVSSPDSSPLHTTKFGATAGG